MTTRPTALHTARRALGWSQSRAARELAELARTRSVPVASPASLKTQLSRWENGHATPEAPYRALLTELYAESGWRPDWPGPDEPAAGSADRLRSRLAAAAAVDTEVITLWHTQLATAQRLDDRLGAAGAAAAVRVLVEQLEAVLPHVPDPARRRPVAALLTRACLLAGAQARDQGDLDAASTRYARAGEVAGPAGAPDLAVAAAIGHAEVLLDAGASPAARALLAHAGVDVAHPPPGLPVELATRAQRLLHDAGQGPGSGSAESSSASAAR